MVHNQTKTITSLKRLPIIGIFLLTFIAVQCYGKYISLNSDDWTLRDKTYKYRITNVTVPGGLYTDLFSARIIDDPLYDKNDVNYRNFSNLDWIWSKNFNVNADDLQPSNELYLIINGIDTISSIYVNGVSAGKTKNMFAQYKFNVRPHLRPGENRVEVVIQSSTNYAKAKASNYKDKYNYTIVPECWPDVYNGECHANFIRKMAASFSWDWGPAFPSSGIWLPIGIEVIQTNVYFENFWASLGESKDGNNWTIDLTLNILSTSPETSIDVQVLLSTDHYLDENFEREFVIYNGSIVLLQSNYAKNYDLFGLNIPRSQVDLWWPNGMSVYSNSTAKPRLATLYNLTTTVTSKKTRQSRSKRIGFRSIKLIQERLKAGKIKLPDGSYEDAYLPGRSFRFEVNGIPLFIKGTNIIPSSVFPENAIRDKAYVKRLLSTVAYSSMNMVRVWGGGIYQTDFFYDLADELGILIWQDFMFACMTYPSNIDFLTNVRAEVTHQVIRLAHHPSIALWSGNNENEIAIATGWWPEVVVNKERYVDDYEKLNKYIIRSTVKRLDGNRIFVSSSPSNGDESKGGIADNPGDPLFGDVHFYSYTADAWNQSHYPEARFISEYGFESYSSLKSYASVMPREKLVYPLSDSLEHRQHHPNGTLEMEAMIAYYFRIPTEMGTINALQKMIYLSQCLQAMAIKAETEVYLRNRKVDPSTGSKLTWGAMYWMLNDIWVSTSWSSVEFGGKWKMLQYYVKNIFKPVHGQIYLRTDPVSGSQMIEAVINNDYTGRVELYAGIYVYKLDSTTPIEIVTKYFRIDSYSADVIFTLDLNQTIISPQICPSLENCLIQLDYELFPGTPYSDNGANYLIPVKPNELNLENPDFKVLSITKVDKSRMKPLLYLNENYHVFMIEFTTERPALFVWLDFNFDSVPIDGVFSDNGFMMLDRDKTVYFQTYDLSCNTERIREHLTITSLKENL